MAAPYSYSDINTYTSPITPSVMHTRGNNLSFYFRKYLFMEVISLFKPTVPETWPKNRLQYLIFGDGKAAVFNTDRFGLIYDRAPLTGFNVFYQPTHVTIANPMIKSSQVLQIGKQCEVMQLRPDYQGVLDICAYYGDMMALCSQALQSNLINSRLAYVFAAGSKAGAESFKKMFDSILQGDPAVFVDKDLYKDMNSNPPWIMFDSNLRANFIAPDLQSELRNIKAAFDTEIGIPNANTDKKERLISAEVNQNNTETMCKATLWLEYLQDSCKRVHKLFGLTKADLWFDWRFPPVSEDKTEEEALEDESIFDVPRDV